MLKIPVVSKIGKPLMPCHPARARELIRKNKAIKRFHKGFFYIKLTDREDGKRICQNAKVEDVEFLCYNSFRIRRYPLPKGRGF